MKRGQPPTRKTQLGRDQPPRPSRTPIRSKGRSRFPKRRNDAFRAWIREQPCVVDGLLSGFVGRHRCGGRIECAHVKSVSTGGDDVGNCIPLCSRAHRWADWSPHRGGIESFAQQFAIDLPALAQRYADEYAAGLPAGGPPDD